MLLRKLSTTYGIEAYTEEGDFLGKVEECIITKNKIQSWRIGTAPKSLLKRILGRTTKGVIIPHRFVKAISDIMIVAKISIPKKESEDET